MSPQDPIIVNAPSTLAALKRLLRAVEENSPVTKWLKKGKRITVEDTELYRAMKEAKMQIGKAEGVVFSSEEGDLAAPSEHCGGFKACHRSDRVYSSGAKECQECLDDVDQALKETDQELKERMR